MPRKKRSADVVANQAVTNAFTESAATETLPAPANQDVAGNNAIESQDGPPKNWGPPYKAIITCTAKGFEMGENRRFNQRVFKFMDKPDAEIITVLKENGFTYRPEEKAWTIHADNASRELSDQLAAQFAGESKDLFR